MKMIELDLRPDAARLRQFGWLAFGIVGALAAWAFWRGHLLGIDLGANARNVATTLGSVAGISALFSLVWPTGNRLLYTILTLVAYPIGTVVSYGIMLVLFYLIITPVGLFFRVIGRDALHRRFDRAASTYWVEHRTPEDISRYFRQF